jgi:mannosylglycoprotein endo-beta-mannosidase
LCVSLSETEIKNALFLMERNKAPGPDKIPIEFYQCCWDIVKRDIVDLFNDFHGGKVQIKLEHSHLVTKN